MELIGAIKVKDGLFVGDEFAAQDLEFIVANKVTRVVNCAAKQIPNHWESIGIKYLPLYWQDTEKQRIFSSSDPAPSDIFEFIEQSTSLGESILVHSVRGQSRAVCVVAVYFLLKYKWALSNTLEFLHSRRPDMNVRPHFLAQLTDTEKLLKHGAGNNLADAPDQANCEELVVRNTYINARMHQLEEFLPPPDNLEKDTRLNWADAGLVKNFGDIDHAAARNPVDNGFAILKSCVKGSASESRQPLQVLKTQRKARASNIGGSPAVAIFSQDDMHKLANELKEPKPDPKARGRRTKSVKTPPPTLKKFKAKTLF